MTAPRGRDSLGKNESIWRTDMKAAVYYEVGAPEVLKYEEIPDPECGPIDVVIDVEAISLEGGDVIHRAFGEIASTPHVVGYQAAGTITRVGEQVTDRKPGQRVTTLNMSGSHAEKRAVPYLTAWVLPDAVSFEEGACIPVTFGIAHECLFEFGRLRKGEIVLVQGGAGGVGIAAIQMAKRAGARVLATASSDEKLARLGEYGMDEGINYKEKNLVEEVMRLTSGSGANLVVDPVGGTVLAQSIAAAAHRGRIVSCGTASRDFSKVDISGLAQGNKSLTGAFLGAEVATERVRNMVSSILDDVAAKEIKVPIDSTYALSRAAEAHAYIESRKAIGRVVLIP